MYMGMKGVQHDSSIRCVSNPFRNGRVMHRAAAIWSSADIVHIAIYRDMSKISRYIFMVIKVMNINDHW